MEAGDPVLRMSDDELDTLIDSWADPQRPLSEHLKLAVSAAFHRRQRGLPPLGDNDPIPGCGCPTCTGIAQDHPARKVSRKDSPAKTRPALNVDGARAVPILEVAARFGLGEPVRAGRQYQVLCPFHQDGRPSLRLDPAKGVWHCFPCGEGGDGIALVMRLQGVTFVEAVRELAS